MAEYPMSSETQRVLQGCSKHRAHPGLLLDRFAGYPSACFDQFKQEDQLPHLDYVVQAMDGARTHSAQSLSEWDELVQAAGFETSVWCQTTVWRLALHLSRATAVENASLSLHPLYGFPYLPGSGLKGLAQAQATLNGADRDLQQRVFGTTGAAGSVAFLEAWPRSWPKVEVDIVNNHHKEYYKSLGKSPPGDWESPEPVYFLTVAPGQEFRFAVGARTERTPPEDIEQARDWLIGGLMELGAGAKTAAGYGYFGEAREYSRSTTDAPGSGTVPARLEGFAARLHEWLQANPSRSTQGTILNLIAELSDGQLKSKAAQMALEAIRGRAQLEQPGKRGRPSMADELRKYLNG